MNNINEFSGYECALCVRWRSTNICMAFAALSLFSVLMIIIIVSVVTAYGLCTLRIQCRRCVQLENVCGYGELVFVERYELRLDRNSILFSILYFCFQQKQKHNAPRMPIDTR